MDRNSLIVGLIVLALAGCAHIPGETLTSGGMQRDIKARVLSLASAAKPGCKLTSIVNTEVLEVHPNGKVSTERWTVDQCGERVHYRVNLPPSRGGSNFTVSLDG